MCVQENPLMHNGHPCEELYPDEYFEEGITNGAQWYNVPGMPAFFHPPLFLTTFILFFTGDQPRLVEISSFLLCN